MLNSKPLVVLLLSLVFCVCVSSQTFAQPDAPAEAPAAEGMDASATPLLDAPEAMPFQLRDIAVLLICIAGVVAVIVLGTNLPGFPTPFFAAGIGFLAIDPIADLVVFHLLQSDHLKSPSVTYAGISVLSFLLGVVFLVLGVHRMRDLLRRAG